MVAHKSLSPAAAFVRFIFSPRPGRPGASLLAVPRPAREMTRRQQRVFAMDDGLG